MARKINLEEPLSAEDRRYLVDRCRWAQLALADGLGSPQEAQRQAEAARLKRPSPGPDPQPATVVTGGAPPEPTATGDDLDNKPYEEWPYTALQEELKVRKQEAVDAGMDADEANRLYAAGGKTSELVARLVADDERVEAENSQE